MDTPLKIIEINADTIEKMHIGCAISATGDGLLCANSKKDWMRNAFKDGYQFHRLDAQGKALIETIPAEHAWAPIQADGWLMIDCFWVSGQFKGKGVASALLRQALERAKREGRKGLVALSAEKKRPFLSDPGFYLYKGFHLVDTAPPYYTLLALPLEDIQLDMPRFLDVVREPIPQQKGLVLYYSNHCPHTIKYVPILEKTAQELGVPIEVHPLQNAAQAQAAPNPFPTYALYYEGKFVDNEIYSAGKLRKFIESKRNP